MRPESLNSRVSLQSAAFLAVTVAGQAITALTYLLAARDSTPSAFGVAAAALAGSAWLVAVVDFGFIGFALRELSAGRMDSAGFYSRVLSKALLLLSASILLSLLGWLLGAESLAAVGVIALGRLLTQSFNSLLRAHHRVHTVLAVTVLEPVVALAAFLTLRLVGISSATALLLGVAVAVIPSSIASFAAARRALPVTRPVRPRGSWRAARGMGMSGLAAAASDLDTVIVASLSPALAGEYAAIARWTRPVVVATHSFSLAASPVISGAASARGALVAVRPALWMPGLALLYSVLLAALGPMLVPILLGPAYAGSAYALVVLSLVTLLSVPNQLLAMLLTYRGHDRPVGVITLVASLCQLLAVVPLAGWLGAVGVSIAAGVGKLLSLCGLLAVALNIHLTGRQSRRQT